MVLLALVASAFFVFLGYQTLSFNASTTLAPVVPVKAIIVDQLSPTAQIAGTKIQVEIATTSAAVQKGLSGRSLLDADKGMLFIFARPDTYRFWMPDMHFPLDMIWIQNGTVVDISKNVSNKFNPAAPKFYTPSSPVQYVLEVNAGFSARKHIRIGDAVTFTNLQ